MARRRVSTFLCLFLLSSFIVSSCGLFSHEDGKYKKLKSDELGIFHFPRRELVHFFFPKVTIHDKIELPLIHPSPPNIPAPSVVNIPPPPTLITVTPNPIIVPGGNPSTTPVPVPNTNPTSSYPPPNAIPVTQPVMPPPVTVTTPPNPGRGWCVAKSGAPPSGLQAALDYACGTGVVDCSVLQQGGTCYNPVTLENHASYAFNSYYQRNPVPTSCDFGGTAMITSTNPSSGSCIFPLSSPTSLVPPPVTQTPTQTPPPPYVIPTPPAFPAPPAAPTPPAISITPAPPAFPTPPAFPPPPAFPTQPSFPPPPVSLRPPASPTPPISPSGTPMPRISAPASSNFTNNSTSGFPMGGFPNIFPIVNTSMPPDSPLSVTSMSKPSTLPQPFIGGIIFLTFVVTWNHILDI